MPSPSAVPSPMASSPAETSADRLRGRYRLVTEDGAKAIVCGNSTNIRLHVVRGLTVDRRSRKRYPPQTIFLDGVFGEAPFCDNEARHYSLDHHAGVIRGFTLATCEQAVVMILQGLPLASGSWSIWVNDPDLDSVLAAWVLINHMELLRDERALLTKVMPLVRVEGVIDAHGTEMEILSALPEAAHARAKAEIDGLMKRERELKTSGRWTGVDWLPYVVHLLEDIDRLVLSEEALADLLEIDEKGRAGLGDRTAVLIRSTDGIYEVEARLKGRYGAHLGVIVLDQGGGRFTLRQVDTFLKRDLNAVYKALNKTDPKADPYADPPNAWGGSGNLGGSPRVSGTGLTGDQILAVIARVVGPREPLWKRLYQFLRASIAGKPRALPPGQ